MGDIPEDVDVVDIDFDLIFPVPERSDGTDYVEPESETLLFISFTREALGTLRRIGTAMYKHAWFELELGELEPLTLPGADDLDEIIELFCGRLAMYVAVAIKNLRDPGYIKFFTWMITQHELIVECNMLWKRTFMSLFNLYPGMETIQYMLDGYPLSILKQVSRSVDEGDVHIMGECVRSLCSIMRFSKTSSLPDVLQIDCGTQLEGNVLTKLEVEALYRYIGCRKSYYVHLLLQILFEQSKQKTLSVNIMNEGQILELCSSVWVYVFLMVSYDKVMVAEGANINIY